MIRWLLVIAFVVTAFSARAENRRLETGQILVLSMDVPVSAVVVGDPEILDVAVEGEKAVLVFGRSPGASDVVMLNSEHEVVYSARFTVAGPAEPEAERAEPPVAVRDRPTVTVRGPTDQGMGEVQWVCDSKRRCRKGASE